MRDFYLNVQVLEGGFLPTRAHSGDAGLDLYSPVDKEIRPFSHSLIPLNIIVEFPIGYVMLILEKSGKAVQWQGTLGAKVVDCSYRGIPHVHIINHSLHSVIEIEKGEKIAQALFIPCWSGLPTLVNSIDCDTDRGNGGFGSTEELRKIKVNSAKCLNCGDILISRSIHDFVTCKCGNLSVDGGNSYLKRSIKEPHLCHEMSKYE